MFPKTFHVVLWGLLGLSASAAYAVDPWQGSSIMPKSDQVVLRVGGEDTADVYAIEWPASVERIEGQWLWISDHGGYRVPPVAGWVSKDDVLKVADAHDYYMRILQTMDAPWVHWLVGICLEKNGEKETAQAEYARSLNVPASGGGEGSVRVDGNAVQMAVERNANLLDAAVRLERLQAAAGKSAEEAATAADLLQKLAETVERDGIRRPYLCFERAEALRKAFRSQVAEERKSSHGIEAQIDRANSEKDGGAGEATEFFKKAEAAYKCSTSEDPGYVCAGPHCWKGHMGRAELYLDRVFILENEAWSLIAAGAKSPTAKSPTAKSPTAKSPTAKSPTAKSPTENAAEEGAVTKIAADESPTGQLDVATAPLDLKMLDDYLSQWPHPQQSPQQKSVEGQADAVCVCLAEEIRALHEAVTSFNSAVSQTPDLIEAYRDRGAAYLLLARCEATLAAIEKADPALQSRFAQHYPDPQLSPQKLDRTLVEGRRQYAQQIDNLPAAKATVAEVTAERKALADAMQQTAVSYIGPTAFKSGCLECATRDKGKGASALQSALQTMQAKVTQLKANAARAWEQLDEDERKAENALSAVNAALDQSYTMLSKSENLRQARRSAQSACEKGDFANTESLKILAAIFAAQCNFDRAEFYQKLATTYASDDERRQILKTLNDYRQMGELAVSKAKPYTATPLPGQGKGAKTAGAAAAGDAPSAE
jgi:hypothetical protein